MKSIVIAVIMLLATLSLPLQAAKPLKPLNKGAFETQKYRNVFVEMGYKAEADILQLKRV
jgi:oligosaccharide reducing-end xylanase